MALLELRGAQAGYGARAVLRGVDLSVSGGELVAVLGPNGAGKSTLVRACLGLLPLSAGEASLLGRPVGAYTRRELAKVAAWVPQVSDEGVGFTGLELVAMGRSPHLSFWGLPSARDLERAAAVMAELSLSALAARRSTEMSGGERRLLALARALVQEPRVLLLDEPTAFLDVHHQVEALARVKARVEQGLGALAVLHDVNLASAFADRVVLLKDGAVLCDGPTAEVLTAAWLEKLYGVPVAEAVAGGQRVFAPRA